MSITKEVESITHLKSHNHQYRRFKQFYWSNQVSETTEDKCVNSECEDAEFCGKALAWLCLFCSPYFRHSGGFCHHWMSDRVWDSHPRSNQRSTMLHCAPTIHFPHLTSTHLCPLHIKPKHWPSLTLLNLPGMVPLRVFASAVSSAWVFTVYFQKGAST